MTSAVDVRSTSDSAGGGNQYFSSSQSSISLTQPVTPSSAPLSLPAPEDRPHTDSNSAAVRSVVAEGMLCKYTNVVNGWKNRWFVLNNDVLEYYEKEDHKCNLQKPRGTLSIFGANVVPSEDDYLTFTVTTLGGQTLKLKASDQKERSFWITRLRQAATTSVSSAISWSAASASSSSQLTMKSSSTALDSPMITPRRNNEMSLQPPLQKTDSDSGGSSGVPAAHSNEQRASSAIGQAQSSFNTTCTVRDRLREAIEQLPSRAYSLDSQLLQVKANASAVCQALDQCISAMKKSSSPSTANSRQSGGQSNGSGSNAASTTPLVISAPSQGSDVSPRRPARATAESSSSHSRSSNLLTVAPSASPPPLSSIDHDKAVEDTEKFRETGIGNVEPQRPVILQMLAQLKLGMDLTRVSLPTFILEKRSLLEMFADCMSHPDLFLKITDQSTPELRMNQVLIWYITSIHAGRQGDISKKPYNPIIGETFHCCWDVPVTAGLTTGTGQSHHRVTFTAEQVSHHPPVSAFYLECPAKGVTLNGSIWTKSQFLGMSIGAQMIGQITLSLTGIGETYVMTLPSAYARSILSYPWVELGDRCTITCPQTGYAASVVFHTKGSYGGTLHRVSGEIHPPNSSAPSLRFSGDWTGRLDFNLQSGEAFTIDVNQLQLFNKKVRPMAMQYEWESRRLWQSVTQALKNDDIDAATVSKKKLEEQQRQVERTRKDKNVVYEAKYFDRTGTNEYAWSLKNSARALTPSASLPAAN